MSGTFTSLLIVEAIITAAAVGLFLYRATLDMKEEDHVVLDSAESHLMRDQASIREKIGVLTKFIRGVSVAWGVVLATILGVWIVEGLSLV